MKKIRKAAAALLALTIGFGTAFAAQSDKEYEQAFTDVSNEHWAFKYISELAETDILSGYPDGTFKPDNPVTRAELAKILTSAFDLQPSEFVYSDRDLSEDAWYYNYLLCAGKYIPNYALPEINENNQPYIDNKTNAFLPNQNALRMHVAEALVDIIKNKDAMIIDVPDITVVKDELNKAFKDTNYDEDYLASQSTNPGHVRRMLEYTYLANKLGIMQGDTEGYFRPYDYVTRAEVATILWQMRVAEDKTDTTEPTPTPTPTPTPAPIQPSADEDIFTEPHYFETSLAVVQKAAQKYTTADGDDGELVQVLHNGKKGENLLFKTGVYSENELGVGDVFFFGTNRFGMVDEIYLIYDYSEDEFMNLTAKDWSASLWDEGTDYRLAEGYIAEVTDDTIMLAPRTAIEAGYLDTSIDIDDDHDNGVAVFGLADDCLIYEFDAFNDNLVGTANKLNVKSYIKASHLDKLETEDGIYEGALIDCADYAVVIVEDDVVTEIYTIVK